MVIVNRYNKYQYRLFILCFFSFALVFGLQNRRFVIVTTSYNNAEYFDKNLASVFSQDYDNWSMIYIDDCSIDGTGDLVENFILKYDMYDKVEVVRNDRRMGHGYNQYHAIHRCSDDAIIVNVDGDDWLAHEGVLSYLNEIYQDDVWITYGQFKYFSSGSRGCSRKIPDGIIAANGIRDYNSWITSHLRTFYAGLYKKIKRNDLMLEGEFLPMSVDVGTMIPMIEMAGHHSRFISDTLYIYNDTNGLSFFHDRREQQRVIMDTLRSYQKYKPLQKAPY